MFRRFAQVSMRSARFSPLNRTVMMVPSPSMALSTGFCTATQSVDKASWDFGFLTHAEVAKRFEEFDRDGNGFITVAECRAAMDRLEREISDGVVRESMFTWDQNHDGVVDYFEFMDYFLQTNGDKHAEKEQFDSIEEVLHHCIVKDNASIANNMTRQAKTELIQNFKLIDLDSDGFISKGEMMIALKTMSPDASAAQIQESLEHIFKTADANSDGLIDLYEFSARVVQDGLYSTA
jgi:Ca2+-binding EF-hand superfamily protein